MKSSADPRAELQHEQQTQNTRTTFRYYEHGEPKADRSGHKAVPRTGNPDRDPAAEFEFSHMLDWFGLFLCRDELNNSLLLKTHDRSDACPISDHWPTRHGRNGRGVSRPGQQARSRGRDQSVACVSRSRSGTPGRCPAAFVTEQFFGKPGHLSAWFIWQYNALNGQYCSKTIPDHLREADRRRRHLQGAGRASIRQGLAYRRRLLYQLVPRPLAGYRRTKVL